MNYRPISILPSVSKVLERIMQKQIAAFIEKHLYLHMCGYRKGYNTQHALLILLEKWRRILDKQGYAGAIIMDLSKAFDTINHDLLLGKLHAYGFDMKSLLLIKNYLSNRWHRTRINTSFSSWEELLHGVPQGSVLGHYYLTFISMTYFICWKKQMPVARQMILIYMHVI